MQPKIIIFAGSAREGSMNKKLAKVAAVMAESMGAQVTYIDLKDYSMPLYDGDLEAAEGLPENTIKLKKMFTEHDGFIIASPEYNSSVTPLLKNTLDWLSRPHEDNEPPLTAFRGKTAALISTSPGALGGLRGLVHLRSILGNIGVHVMPSQTAIGNYMDAFADDGSLKNPPQQKMLEGTIAEMVATTRAVAAAQEKVAA